MSVRLSGPVRRVLRALAAAAGRKLAVRHLAADTGLSPSAVRVALAALGKAGLVQHVLAPGQDRQPPRAVYWPTRAGYDVAAGLPAKPRG